MLSGRIVSVARLKGCRLWDGSSEQQDFKFCGGLSLERVEKKVASLERCDDRTPAEEEYLAALRQTIADIGW